MYIYVFPYVKCALFRVSSNVHVQPAQKIKGKEAERAQHVGGSELAILHQSSKLLNGTLDVA